MLSTFKLICTHILFRSFCAYPSYSHFPQESLPFPKSWFCFKPLGSPYSYPLVVGKLPTSSQLLGTTWIVRYREAECPRPTPHEACLPEERGPAPFWAEPRLFTRTTTTVCLFLVLLEHTEPTIIVSYQFLGSNFHILLILIAISGILSYRNEPPEFAWRSVDSSSSWPFHVFLATGGEVPWCHVVPHRWTFPPHLAPVFFFNSVMSTENPNEIFQGEKTPKSMWSIAWSIAAAILVPGPTWCQAFPENPKKSSTFVELRLTCVPQRLATPKDTQKSIQFDHWRRCNTWILQHNSKEMLVTNLGHSFVVVTA